ncbi:VOC family protein [Actinomadura rugatobispora]|uniref:VOC family protein n=1 Tax=Actinomadura rugatobispora TaxID=1994 RepID=A0ABW0ZSN6_9ACTN|nr:VOC family protein [Actinomadura rugatobispora]
MPEITSFEPGAPVGVELSSPNVEASKRFYRGLFGWGSYIIADRRLGDHTLFTHDASSALDVAGLVALADDSSAPFWTCFFGLDDLVAAMAATREAGGYVHLEPTPVVNMGRMVLADDDQGAGIGFWQAYTHPGAGMLGDPNSMCWMELVCRDVAAAGRFYGRVLGWNEPVEFEGVTGSPSYLWRKDGRSVASVVRTDLPDGVPAQWIPYFAVADCDATAAEAVRQGGSVTGPCTETSHGRYVRLQDPTAAPLVIIQRHPDQHSVIGWTAES